MFGMGGSFTYFECQQCGCLQQANPPDDLSQYYPSDRYYSLQENQEPGHEGFLGWLNHRRHEAAIFGRPRIFQPLVWFKPYSSTPALKRFLDGVPEQSFNCRILDVGCGSGGLLNALRDVGFRHLHGVDPFLADRPCAPGIKLHRCKLPELDETPFDLILLIHSLEHMHDQVGVLKAVRKRLGQGGICQIEIPVASSDAWRQYRTEWVELDAPRHLFLHTPQSLEIAANAAGLEICTTEPAGTPFEFHGSEMYRRGKSLYDSTRHRMRDPAEEFTPREIEEFKRSSAAANKNGSAGRLVFRLRRREMGYN
jgi:SAM-dependent methyltransferase